MESTDQDASAVPAKTSKARRKPRKWFSNKIIAGILACGVLGLVLGYFAAMTQPYMWRVEATLLAHVGRESGSARPEIIASGGSSHIVGAPSAESLNTEINLLKSPELLRQTWNDVKERLRAMAEDRKRRAAERNPDGPAAEGGGGGGGGGGFSLMGLLNQGVTQLYKALDLAYEIDEDELEFAAWSATLQVVQIPRSNMLLATASSPNPQVAKVSLERWLRLYQEKHIEAYSQKETEPLFIDQTKKLTLEVRDIEKKLTEFHKEHDVFDVDAAQRTLLNQKMGYDDQLRDLEAQMATSRKRLEELDRRIAELPDQSPQSSSRAINPTWDYLERQLVEAKQKLKEAEADYPEGSIFIRQRQETCDFLAELLKEQDPVREATKVVGRDPIFTDLQRDLYQAKISLASDAARKVALQANLAEVTQELIKLEGLRAEHKELLDELAEKRKDLVKFKEGARIARMNSTLDQARVTNVRIVSPPSIPSEPVMLLGLPHRVAITGMGGALGLFLAIGLYLVIMALREAGLLKKAAAAGAAVEAAPDERELGVWAITDDDDWFSPPPKGTTDD